MIIGVFATAAYAEDGKELNILFIHDSHDYLYPTSTMVNGSVLEHGGAARLATIIKENSDENTIVLLDRALMKELYPALASNADLKVYPYEKRFQRN
mgnify:CR=1 FL=1